MKTEKIQLSSLQRDDVNVPTLKYTPTEVDAHNGVLNNTFVEDQVLKQDGSLTDGNIAQRIQRLNDKKNQYSTVNRRFANINQEIIDENLGQGITALGRGSQIASRQNEVDAERTDIIADIEELRGNIESSKALRIESNRMRGIKESKAKAKVVADEAETTEDLLALYGVEDTRTIDRSNLFNPYDKTEDLNNLLRVNELNKKAIEDSKQRGDTFSQGLIGGGKDEVDAVDQSILEAFADI
jgi:hypothetical protein